MKVIFGLIIIAIISSLFLLYYGGIAYLIWNWYQPKGFLQFMIFMLIWTAVSIIITWIFKRIIIYISKHYPPLIKLIEKKQTSITETN
jgi:hypothetical protein